MIALGEAKIEKVTIELARLKRWTYGAKSKLPRPRAGAKPKASQGKP
ncbi:hypothetical protein WDZ92_43080 [Nostoc sp. NIES-2111]